ncbi:hypothetical protein P8452_57012 [Trifolium repens]|nr:hypothetical protein P8452_57012 [Trifolium repens]
MEDETKMAQEQEDQSRNNGINGGNRSTKKQKQKRVPQRGLGVAQLERILEEQNMKDFTPSSSQNFTPSSSSSTISSFLPIPINNFNHSNYIKEGTFILPSSNSASSSSSTTISHYLPPPITNFNHMNQNSSTSNLPLPPLGEFRSSLSMQHLDGKVPVPVPSTVSLPNSGVFGNVPKLWNSHHELNFDKENGLPFLPTLPFDSNQIWPMSNWVQRTQQFHHQHPSQVVNNSSGTSSTHVPQLSIEPPSNQNYSINGTPVRPAEKMMIGMKRPYPFSLDFSQATALNYKLPPNAEIGTNSRRTSCESESGFHFVAGNSTSRESQSCSASNSDPNSKKRDKGIKELDGSFLTLAPPSPASLNNQESPEEHVIDRFHTGYKLVNQQKQPLYSFIIPAAKETQNGQPALRIQNGHEVEENIDLNLKL